MLHVPYGSVASGGDRGGDAVAGCPSRAASSYREPEAMSTKELKAALTARGVPHEHCLEKAELAELLSRVLVSEL